MNYSSNNGNDRIDGGKTGCWRNIFEKYIQKHREWAEHKMHLGSEIERMVKQRI